MQHISLLFYLSMLALGFRHGFEADHLAAITDIVSSEKTAKNGLWGSMLYSLGHSMVVIILGVLAITVGVYLPHSVDLVIEKFVGITLILLAGYVIYQLFTKGDEIELKSRWRLIFESVVNLRNWVNRMYCRLAGHPECYQPKHVPDKLGPKTYFGLGCLHGIGVETPTQIAALSSVSAAGMSLSGSSILICFCSGMIAANMLFAWATAYSLGLTKYRKVFYITTCVLTAIFGLVVGVMVLLGKV
jgi:high-affinity nickel-transport protein